MTRIRFNTSHNHGQLSENSCQPTFCTSRGQFWKIALAKFSLRFHLNFGLKIFLWVPPLFSPQILLFSHFHSTSKQVNLFSLPFSLYPSHFHPFQTHPKEKLGAHVLLTAVRERLPPFDTNSSSLNYHHVTWQVLYGLSALRIIKSSNLKFSIFKITQNIQ